MAKWQPSRLRPTVTINQRAPSAIVGARTVGEGSSKSTMSLMARVLSDILHGVRGATGSWRGASPQRFVATCVALVIPLLSVTCGSSPAASQSGPPVISGAASCPTAEKQDLTFSGDLTGHLSCATSQPVCGQARSLLPNGVSVDLNARIGGSPVQFLIAFGHGDPGTYSAGTLGDEPMSSLDGATLDGVGHWNTAASGGTMTVTLHDGTAASGLIAITLTMASQTARVSGTWRCVTGAGA